MRQWGCVRATEDYTVATSGRSVTATFAYLIGGFFSWWVCLWDGSWEEDEIPAGVIRREAVIREKDVGL